MARRYTLCWGRLASVRPHQHSGALESRGPRRLPSLPRLRIILFHSCGAFRFVVLTCDSLAYGGIILNGLRDISWARALDGSNRWGYRVEKNTKRERTWKSGTICDTRTSGVPRANRECITRCDENDERFSGFEISGYFRQDLWFYFAGMSVCFSA